MNNLAKALVNEALENELTIAEMLELVIAEIPGVESTTIEGKSTESTMTVVAHRQAIGSSGFTVAVTV